MKKFFLLSFLFISIASYTKAQGKFEEIQHYKFFKVQADVGFARPSGSGSKSGVLLALEPKVNLTDKLSVGLRMEASAIARGYVDVSGTEISGEAGLGFAVLATGDYYFTTRMVRPFIGAGTGIYNLVSVEARSGNGGSISIPAVTKLGGMIRAGVEIWHVRAGVHYNFIGKTGQINNNYMGITIGLVFGGGVKDEYTGRDN